MKLATIDIGTNSILLLVVDAEGGTLRPLDDRCRIERLGRGVDKSGALDPAAIARALDALREYAGAIREAGVERVGVVGTQALREARNAADFLGPAREILGVEVEVIGGKREASLAWNAVLWSFPSLRSGDLVVCDVGGGSTELIVGRDGVVVTAVSLPIGSVRMTERHLHSDPPTAGEVAAMTADLDAALAAVTLPEGATLVGTAGTVTTLAATSIGLTPYDPDRVQGHRMSRTQVDAELQRYLSTPLAERNAIVGLDAKRADVIAGGAAVVARVMARMNAAEMIVSDRGIRWGLAAELSGLLSP